jgi:MraZ protein
VGRRKAEVFRGCFEHTIDEKGRVSIPATFRKTLFGLQDERLIVTKFISNTFRCLDVYPYAEWESLELELIKKPRFDETFFKLESFYLANAQECPVDKQGRILLPPMLREFAGIDKEVVFAAALKKFRIWDKAAWARFSAESEQQFSQNPQLFSSLNV